MKHHDVAIVGMGCVFPGAPDVDAYWRNIVNGVDAISEMSPNRWHHGHRPLEEDGYLATGRGGFLPERYLHDPIKHKVMPNVARYGDKEQFILLDVVTAALDDARIAPDAPSRERTDLVVGRGGYPGSKLAELYMRADGYENVMRIVAEVMPQAGPAEMTALESELTATLPPDDVDALASAIPNLVASRTANRLDLGGLTYTLDAACASSLLSVEHAVERLRLGRCDVAVAAGINFTHYPAFWYMFARVGAMSLSGSIRPFDSAADGLLIGEGAGAVVLKRSEDAIRDGDQVYAVIKGTGSSSDGSGTGILAPSATGQVRALRRAYEDAGVDPDTIGLLEAHGTATTIGDATEIETIARFFGPPLGRYATRAMGSVKSMIGHTMPAAGIASLIKSALAVSNQILPPSLHCSQPHEALGDAAFYVNDRTRPWVNQTGRHPRRAGVNAFGFGGANAHVVLEEVPSAVAGVPRSDALSVLPLAGEASHPPDRGEGPMQPRPLSTAIDRPSEVLCFTGADRDDIAAQVTTAAEFVRSDRVGWRLEDLAYTLSLRSDAGAPVRLAVIVTSGDGLLDRLDGLAGLLRAGEDPATGDPAVYFDEVRDDAGRVAALFPAVFPGLSGEFPQHQLETMLHFPASRQAWDAVDGPHDEPFEPLPVSFQLDPPPHVAEPDRQAMPMRFVPPMWGRGFTGHDDDTSEVSLAHLGVTASNWANWQIVRQLGIDVDMSCGVSLGDVCTLWASGIADYGRSMDTFAEMLTLGLTAQGLGSLAYLGASIETGRQLMEGLDDVGLAMHLSPQTLVVGGSDEAVFQVCDRARQAGVIAMRIPFAPVHTPRFEPIQREIAPIIGAIVEDRLPQHEVYSALTAGPLPAEPDIIRTAFISNLSQPVRFFETLQAMRTDGAGVFIQVGSGGLAHNIRSMFTDDPPVAVATDVEHRHPLTQVQHMVAELLTIGVDVDLGGLFEGRTPTDLPLETPRPAVEPAPRAVPLMMHWSVLHDGHAPRAPTNGKVGPLSATPTEGPEEPAPPQPGSRADSPLPLLGSVTEFAPQRRIATEVRLDLSTDRFLVDHVFVKALQYKPANECYPVVPLTFTLETLAEAAACLAPGLGLITVDRVRARRWVAFEEVDERTLRVEAEVTGDADGAVQITARALADEAVVASAELRFAREYRRTVDLSFAAPTNERAFPVGIDQLYEEYLFHGPMLQCVTAIQSVGDRSVVGEIEVGDGARLFSFTDVPQLILDPVVLDGAGQLVGSLFYDTTFNVLPVAIERIEWYRPPPPPGTRVPVRVEHTDFDVARRVLEANIEVQDGAGAVWFRVVGWRDRVSQVAPEIERVRVDPHRHTITSEIRLDGLPDDAVAMWLPSIESQHTNEALLARTYLHSNEWGEYQQARTRPHGGRRMLQTRAAIKDAARRWAAAQVDNETMPHPAQFAVSHNDAGRPFIAESGEDRTPPWVSASRSGEQAIAVAAASPVAVDLEPLGGGAPLEPSSYATDDEVRAVAASGIDAATALWCIKEAAAKLAGTGLEGRPKRWEVTAYDGNRATVSDHDTGERYSVTLGVHDGMAAAVAVPLVTSAATTAHASGAIRI